MKVWERIVLHLAQYEEYKEEFMVPYELTQDGIAKAVGIQRSHVPMYIKKLINRGLVFERKAHIINGQRRRKVYFLTEMGLKCAEGLDAERKETKRISRGFIYSINDSEFFRLLKSFNNLIIITNYPSIILKEVHNIRAKIYKPPPDKNIISFIQEIVKRNAGSVIVVDDFDDVVAEEGYVRIYGEIDILHKLIVGTSSVLILVTGFALKRYPKLFRDIVKVAPEIDEEFYDREEELESLSTLITSGKKVFVCGPAGIGKTTLVKKTLEKIMADSVQWVECLEEMKPEDLSEIINIPHNIIVFDNVERLSDDAKRYLYDRVYNHKKACILISRDSPPKNFVSITLGGLPLHAVKKMFRNRIQAEYFHKITGGNPLYLKLIRRYGGQEIRGMYEYLDREIYSKLTDDERICMKILALAEQPLSGEILENLGLIQSVKRLEEKVLVNKEKDSYYIHDFIKDFFMKKMDGREIGELSEMLGKAAENYEDYTLAIKMYIKSGKFERALSVIGRNIEIVDQKALTIKLLLDKIGKYETSEEVYEAFQIIKAYTYYRLGKWDEALKMVEKYEESNNERVRELARKIKAYMLVEMGEVNSALKLIKKMSGNFCKKCLYAYCYRKMGLYDQAEKLLKELIKDTQNKSYLLRLYMELASLYINLEKFNTSLEYFAKAKNLILKLKDLYGYARISLDIGNLYRAMGELKNSAKYLEEARAIFKKLGNHREYAWATISAAETYVSMNIFERAEKYLNRATEILRGMDDTLGLAMAHRVYGILYRHLKEWDKSIYNLMLSLKYIENLGLPEHQAHILFELGLTYRELGDENNAKKMLESSLSKFREVGTEFAYYRMLYLASVPQTPTFY